MKLNVILFLALVFLGSCAKNEIESNLKNRNSSATVMKKSGYSDLLYFPNDSLFNETLEYLANKDADFILRWSADKNFKPMRQIIEKIVQEELEIARKYENMTEVELDSVRLLPIEHSPLIAEYQNLILERQTGDGGNYFDWNIHDFRFANVLNPDGLVIIDSTIVHYDYNYKRIITDGDFNKIPGISEKEESDPANNIIVKKLRDNGSFTRSCEAKTQNNKIKLLVYEDFVQNENDFPGSGTVTTTTYTIKLRSLKRRFWGLWWDNHQTDMKVSGYIEGNYGYGWAPWGGGVEVYFDLVGNSYVYPYPMDQHHTLVYPIGLAGEGIGTENEAPTVYTSTHTAFLVKSGQNPSQSCNCTTNYP